MKFKFNVKLDGIYDKHKFYVPQKDEKGNTVSSLLCVLSEFEIEADTYEQAEQLAYKALKG